MKKFAVYKLLSILVLSAFLVASFCACNDDAAQVIYEPPKEESEFFCQWQNYIKDDVRVVDAVTPGSHDSGCYNIGGGNKLLNSLTETQGASIYEQLKLGVRYFDIRVNRGNELDENKKVVDENVLKIFHDIVNLGFTFERVCDDFNRFFDEYDNQFVILDFQHFGDDVEPDVRDMIEDKLNPEEYAVKTSEDLSTLTYGDIKEEDKRFIIVWGSSDRGDTNYVFPRTQTLLSPYESLNHNYGGEYLIEIGFGEYLPQANSNKFFVLQAQLTNSMGVDGAVTGSIVDLENGNNPIMNEYVRSLNNEDNASILAKINIIMRDFVESDIEKQKAALALNLAKATVKDESIPLFEKMTAKQQ